MKKDQYKITKQKYLSEEELYQLNKLLDDYSEKNPFETTIIRVTLETGARCTETLNIRKQDLDANEDFVYIRGIKGSNDRDIPIKPETMRQLRKIAEHSDTDMVFNISRPTFHRIWVHYRPAKKGIHSLRHTFAINLYKKTKDIRLLQVALGHRNIKNTMVYAEYVYSRQELRRLIS